MKHLVDTTGDSKESGDPGLMPGLGSLGKEVATHSSILAWRIHGQGSLLVIVPGVAKSWG